MASLVFKNAFVSLDTTQITAYIESVALNYSADAPEDTCMGDSSRYFLSGGLKTWDVDVTFHWDSTLDGYLNGAFGTTSAIVIRPTTELVGATNPQFSGNVILTDWPPIGGSVGETAKVTCKFQGTGTLTRATA